MPEEVRDSLNDQGKLDEALKCYREAERIDRTVFGDEHPNVAISVNNIGSVLRAQGKLDEALKYYREAFSIFLRKLGPRAGHTIVCAGNLVFMGVDAIALAGELAGEAVAGELAAAMGEKRNRGDVW